MQVSIDGVREVGAGVISSFLTTACVLGPLAIGIELSMPSILEFISLAGVVANDSILLVLFPKSQVATGADVEASAAQASPSVFERSC